MITCPICRKETKCENFDEDIPTNTSLLKIIEIYKKENTPLDDTKYNEDMERITRETSEIDRLHTDINTEVNFIQRQLDQIKRDQLVIKKERINLQEIIEGNQKEIVIQKENMPS